MRDQSNAMEGIISFESPRHFLRGRETRLTGEAASPQTYLRTCVSWVGRATTDDIRYGHWSYLCKETKASATGVISRVEC